MVTDGSAIPVARPVTIGVSGAHSTGKSTFLARLTHELRRAGYEVSTVPDLGEKAQQIGLPILHNHTFASTLWIMTRGISNEIATWAHTDVLLVDRAVPDALGYYKAALHYRTENADPEALGYLLALARYHASYYDLVLRTVLDSSMPIDTGSNRRDEREDFRQLADEHVESVLDQLDIPYKLLRHDRHDNAVRGVLDLVAQKIG